MSIKVENLTYIYNKGMTYETVAVEDVSFEIPTGGFVGIIGHTGSGKSTLIQHLNGLLKPDKGDIYINGTNITAKDVKMTDIRKRIGLLFQYPEYQLFEETVALDIAFGPKNLGLDPEDIENKVKKAMGLVDMPYEKFADVSPFELSGGQKRRIAIAGVIAMDPEVLILDEPTAGLDPKAHKDILDMILNIQNETNNTVILVSHNMDDIAAFTDMVLVMHKGRIVRQGSPTEVFFDAGYLRSIGLGVPYATEISELLNKKGFKIDKSVLLMDDIEEIIYERFKTK